MARRKSGNPMYEAHSATSVDTGNWTLYAWFRHDTASESWSIIELQNGSVSSWTQYLWVRLDGSNLFLEGRQFYSVGSATARGTTLLTPNKWWFGAAVFDESVPIIRVYLGSLDSPVALEATDSVVSGSRAISAAGLQVSGGNVSAIRYVAEVRYLATGLTIEELEEVRLGNRYVARPGEDIIHLPLDSPTAAVVEDLSGNNYSKSLDTSGLTAVEHPPIAYGWSGSVVSVLSTPGIAVPLLEPVEEDSTFSLSVAKQLPIGQASET